MSESLEGKAVVKTKYHSVISLFFVHKGRVNRLEFLLMGLALWFLFSPLEYIVESGWGGYGVLIAALFIVYLMLCLYAKRLRDIGISGWFSVPVMLLLSVASTLMEYEIMGSDLSLLLRVVSIVVILLSMVVALFVMAYPGQKRENKYGPYEPAVMFWNRKKGEDAS